MGLAWPWEHQNSSDLVPVTPRPLGGVGSIEEEHCCNPPNLGGLLLISHDGPSAKNENDPGSRARVRQGRNVRCKM